MTSPGGRDGKNKKEQEKEKMTALEKKAQELREQAERLENIGYVLGNLKSNMEWDAMEQQEEKDEEGNWIFKAPSENSWRYGRYMAYKEIIELLEKHYLK